MQDSDMRDPSETPSDASMTSREGLFVKFAELSLTATPIRHLMEHWTKDTDLAKQLEVTTGCTFSVLLVTRLAALLSAPCGDEDKIYRDEIIAVYVRSWVLDRSSVDLSFGELEPIAAVLIETMAPGFAWASIEPRRPKVARE